MNPIETENTLEAIGKTRDSQAFLENLVNGLWYGETKLCGIEQGRIQGISCH